MVDSIVHTVYGKDLPDGKDTLWIQLQIMGARKDFDRNYKVVVVEMCIRDRNVIVE